MGTEDARIGLVLDCRYRLLERLGAGGMGVVYRAVHRYTGELVAVKLLTAHATDGGSGPEVRERFLQEPHLQLLARHRNVLRVIDAGVDGGQPYLVTEYVEGEDLQRRLDARGALPVSETLAILHQAAAALDAAHARGVIHRDVKPANVLIRSDGRVFLTDFGVAKDPTGPGGTGAFVGTSEYASPEQITLETAVDERADVYSLGCVMFHCLVGRPPFQAGSLFELMNKQVAEPPPVPSAERPGLPAALDAVLERALAKRRDDRFATCAELLSEAAAATGTDLSTAAPVAAGMSRTGSTAVVEAPAPTLRHATTVITVPASGDGRLDRPTAPTDELTSAPTPGRRRGRRVAAAIAQVAIVGLLGGLLAAFIFDRTGAAPASGPQTSAKTPANQPTGTHAGATRPAPGASGFTGYAARLAGDFPTQISSPSCAVESDGAHPGALVQIHCPAANGRIDAYYELWPGPTAMNRLLDANSIGLNVDFAGIWTDATGIQQGRIDRFFTGLFDPVNVILWSYRSLNATIWAQSTIGSERLLAWWRANAPTVTAAQPA